MKNGSVAVLSRAAIQLCLLTTTVFATRWLPIAEFGVYAIAAAIMFLARNLFYVGPYEYLLKTPDSISLKSSCLLANILLACLSILIINFFAFASPIIFQTNQVKILLFQLGPSVFIAAWTAWFEALLLRDQRMTRYYGFTVIGELFGTLVAIIFLVNGFGLLSLVAQVYARLLMLLVLYISANGDRHWRGYDRTEVGIILRWSTSRYLAVFLNFFSNYGADLVLGALLSPAATGIYRASNRLVSALTDLFAQPLQKIVQTNMSALTARDRSLDHSWLAIFVTVAAIGWTALAMLASLANDIVPVLLGPQWQPAVPVVIIFCLVRSLTLVDSCSTVILVCGDRQRFMLRVQIVVATAVLATSALLASYGVVAVAIGTGFIMAGLTLRYAFEAARISGVTDYDLAVAIGVAMVPALGAILGVVVLRLLMIELDDAVTHFTVRAIATGIGAIIGFYCIRHRLAHSLRSLALAN